MVLGGDVSVGRGLFLTLYGFSFAIEIIMRVRMTMMMAIKKMCLSSSLMSSEFTLLLSKFVMGVAFFSLLVYKV